LSNLWASTLAKEPGALASAAFGRRSWDGRRGGAAGLGRGGGGGHRLIGNRALAMIDMQRAFRYDVDADALAGQTGALAARVELQHLPLERDAVIGAHRAGTTDGKVIGQVQVGGQRHPRRRRVWGRLGETGVVALAEARQEGVGGVQGGDTREAQFFGQPVLQRAPQPLDAPFSLR